MVNLKEIFEEVYISLPQLRKRLYYIITECINRGVVKLYITAYNKKISTFWQKRGEKYQIM